MIDFKNINTFKGDYYEITHFEVRLLLVFPSLHHRQSHVKTPKMAATCSSELAALYKTIVFGSVKAADRLDLFPIEEMLPLNVPAL